MPLPLNSLDMVSQQAGIDPRPAAGRAAVLGATPREPGEPGRSAPAATSDNDGVSTESGESAADPGGPVVAPGRRPRRSARRVTAMVLLILGGVFTGLCVVVLASCWWDDQQIDAHLGRADASVSSVSFNRAAVQFVTPDGATYIPPNGVLYPENLKAGETIRVEYNTQDPNVVRVAGRDYRVAFEPVGLAFLINWVILVPLIWWLRRTPRSRA